MWQKMQIRVSVAARIGPGPDRDRLCFVSAMSAEVWVAIGAAGAGDREARDQRDDRRPRPIAVQGDQDAPWPYPSVIRNTWMRRL